MCLTSNTLLKYPSLHRVHCMLVLLQNLIPLYFKFYFHWRSQSDRRALFLPLITVLTSEAFPITRSIRERMSNLTISSRVLKMSHNKLKSSSKKEGKHTQKLFSVCAVVCFSRTLGSRRGSQVCSWAGLCYFTLITVMLHCDCTVLK